jgi:hypothetical protein
MNELHRKKSYIYAIENAFTATPISEIKLLDIIYLVSLQIGDRKRPSVSTARRWYKQYQSDRRVRTLQNKKGGTCKH